VRVLATWNRRPPPGPVDVPANARLVEWVSYSRTMPRCDLVLCHGGHGTMVRALADACRVVVAPASGDMNENAARVDWAGVGVRVPWRFVSPATVRLAVERALADERMGERVRALGAWSAEHDGAERAAAIVEEFAGARAASPPPRTDGLPLPPAGA
jgi:UDP:flavonoid glycosyltransferase YjiC (YdhE family)